MARWIAFFLGLVLVIVAGAELVTGNKLIVMGGSVLVGLVYRFVYLRPAARGEEP